MKKTWAVILLVLFGFALLACEKEEVTTTTTTTTTSTSQLITEPACVVQNITVQDGILSFDASDACESYEVAVFSSDSEYVDTHQVFDSFDLNYLFEDGSFSLQLSAKYMDGDSMQSTLASDSVTFEIYQTKKLSSMVSLDLNLENYIRYLGRTNYDELNHVRTIYNTGSGFEVGFYGTSVTVTLQTSNTNLSREAYYYVFIDGETNPLDGDQWFIYQNETTLTLVDGLEEGYHTFRIVKRNEQKDSLIYLKSISTDGVFMNPSEEKDLKIEFIGASTMLGYGNLASSPSVSKTTENSDGMLAYPYLASYYLNAEYSIIASSGWGVSRGWNTGGAIDPVKNMVNAYDYVGIDNNGEVVTSQPWDSSSFEPDIIVISLGVNDLNSTGYAYMTESERAAFDVVFRTDYLNFLTHVHTLHPDAIIILAYGILSDNTILVNKIFDVYTHITDETMEVYTLNFVAGGTVEYPYGSDYHPSVGTHLVAALDLAEFIASITDYEIVNSEITMDQLNG